MQSQQVNKNLNNIDFERGYLTEKEVNLLKRRLNNKKLDVNDIPFPEDGFKLSNEQTKKGLDWLMNQYKTPRGIERKNNPFGYREQDVLEDFKEFRLIDFYNTANYIQNQLGIRFYVPYYRVISNSHGNFDYCVYSGEIHILG